MHSFKQSARSLACAIGICATALLSACGGGDQGRDPILGVPSAPLMTVAVTPAMATVASGASQQFVATATYADGASRDVTTEAAWVAAAPAVGTVGAANGLARGVSVGTTNVTATFNGKAGASVLTVTPATLVSIQIAPVNPSINAGATQAFTAAGTFTDATTRDVTAITTFTSATTTVATIAPGTAVARGLVAGSSVITATAGGRSSSTTLTVTPLVLVSLSIAPLNPTVQIGASRQLFVTALYSDNSTINVTTQSTYVSAAPAVASVGPATGLAGGVSAGASLVTASFGGRSVATTVTVPVSTLVSIAVTPNPANILVGATQQFTATGTYSDASTGNITNTVVWTSNNLPVATVLPSGIATGLVPGSAQITATRGAISGFAVLNVTALPVVPPPVLATINLRSADSFAVLAGTALTNNSGGTTFITGDIGSPSQTTDPVQAPGYSNYKSGLPLTQALADLQLAITDANSRTCTVTSAAGIDLGGLVLTPGVYCYAGAISITGTFTMNGPGLYIFRTASTLNATANATVQLLGGATAQNVFWVPVGASTLGANSVFKGTIMAQSAAITAGDNTTLLDGRVLSAAAVTLQNNQIRK